MNGIIKTEDAILNQKIERAVLEVLTLMKPYSKTEQDILEQIFREVINYRIVLLLGHDIDKIAYLNEMDKLYAFLPLVGIEEEKVVLMSKRIISKLI